MQNKKKLYIVIGTIITLLIIGAVVYALMSKNKSETELETVTEEPAPVKKKRISAPQNTIPAEQRPVVTLKPFTKAGGRFVSIIVSQQSIPAERAEYEIVYNVIGASAVDASGKTIKTPAGEEEGGMQAFAGELDLNNLPTKTENRFGTCSAGGACINNSVSGGMLVLNFDASEKYGMTGKWTYFENGNKASQTEDEAFTLESSELAKAKDYIIMEVVGLPAGLEKAVATKPDGGKDNGFNLVAYQINFSNTLAATTAKASFTQAGANDQLAVWDGVKWTEYKTDEELPLADGNIYALIKE